MTRKVQTWSTGSRKPNRSGEVRYVKFSPNLFEAIDKAARAGKRDISGQVAWMCQEWLEGRGSKRRVKIEPDEVVKRGPKPGSHRKPKTTTPETASSPVSSVAGAEASVSQETLTGP